MDPEDMYDSGADATGIPDPDAGQAAAPTPPAAAPTPAAAPAAPAAPAPQAGASGLNAQTEQNLQGIPAQVGQSPGEGDINAQGTNATPGAPPAPAAGGGGMASTIMRYLTGAGAPPQQTVKQLEQQVDPQNSMNPTERNMRVIASAPDDKTAAGYLQSYRQQFDAMKAGAAGSLSGTNKGPANLDTAVQNATLAFSNVPDGINLAFVKNKTGDGVIADVRPLGGDAKQIPLTIPQFNAFLRGPASQFDNMMERHAGQIIQELTASAGIPPSKPGAQPGAQPAQGAPQGTAAAPAQNATPGTTAAEAKIGTDAPGWEGRENRVFEQLAQVGGLKPGSPEAADLRAQFPRAGVDANEYKKATDYIHAQKQEERVNVINETKAKNPLGIAQARGDNSVTRANIVKGTHEDEIASKERIATQNNQTKDQVSRRAGAYKQIAADISNGTLDPATDEGKQRIRSFAAVAGEQPQDFIQHMQQHAQQLQSGGQGDQGSDQGGNQPPPKPAVPAGGPAIKLINGQWMMAGPNGKAVPYAPTSR